MESTIDIRKRIHEFIDHADERILRIINAIITTEEAQEEGLSAEHKEILDERLKEHKENPASGKSWRELKQDLKKEYGI
ncbi:addiction module protein [Chryseobacterium oryctis]|uniref:Addiction module protein n=1 Tax=Chryseobacterium oryctis TaxID=2952618 RepID=A0ABT3HS77_9FLAO|nr:addiction module protein [Chryseobacterium oryctis]MCW3162630.1 addiction module protein [Chryseobacterium oryctis]